MEMVSVSFDARKFLTDLFRPAPAGRPDDLNQYWRDRYEERAGIMEYCGNLLRRQAEALAWAETVRLLKEEKDVDFA